MTKEMILRLELTNLSTFDYIVEEEKRTSMANSGDDGKKFQCADAAAPDPVAPRHTCGLERARRPTARIPRAGPP